MTNRPGHDTFTRAARAIGDLDSPFYDEERQRDVWNEASAVGLQAMIWGTLGLTCAMAWLGGGTAAPWAVALLAVVGVASLLTVGYARRQQVTGLESVRMRRPRVLAFALLYAAAVAGLVAGSDLDLDLPTLAGATVGVGLVLAALTLLRRSGRP